MIRLIPLVNEFPFPLFALSRNCSAGIETRERGRNKYRSFCVTTVFLERVIRKLDEALFGRVDGRKWSSRLLLVEYTCRVRSPSGSCN